MRDFLWDLRGGILMAHVRSTTLLSTESQLINEAESPDNGPVGLANMWQAIRLAFETTAHCQEPMTFLFPRERDQIMP